MSLATRISDRVIRVFVSSTFRDMQAAGFAADVYDDTI